VHPVPCHNSSLLPRSVLTGQWQPIGERYATEIDVAFEMEQITPYRNPSSRELYKCNRRQLQPGSYASCIFYLFIVLLRVVTAGISTRFFWE
jgi:hypothetical protein